MRPLVKKKKKKSGGGGGGGDVLTDNAEERSVSPFGFFTNYLVFSRKTLFLLHSDFMS